MSGAVFNEINIWGTRAFLKCCCCWSTFMKMLKKNVTEHYHLPRIEPEGIFGYFWYLIYYSMFSWTFQTYLRWGDGNDLQQLSCRQMNERESCVSLSADLPRVLAVSYQSVASHWADLKSVTSLLRSATCTTSGSLPRLPCNLKVASPWATFSPSLSIYHMYKCHQRVASDWAAFSLEVDLLCVLATRYQRVAQHWAAFSLEIPPHVLPDFTTPTKSSAACTSRFRHVN